MSESLKSTNENGPGGGLADLVRRFKTLLFASMSAGKLTTVSEASKRFDLVLLLFTRSLLDFLVGSQFKEVFDLIGIEEGVAKDLETRIEANEGLNPEVLLFFDEKLRRMAFPEGVRLLFRDTMKEVQKTQESLGNFGLSPEEILVALEKRKSNDGFGKIQIELKGTSEQTVLIERIARELTEAKSKAAGKQKAFIQCLGSYLKELMFLREMLGLFKESKISQEELFDVQYLNPVDILDEETRELVNLKIKEIASFFKSRISLCEQKITNLTNRNIFLREKIKSISPGDLESSQIAGNDENAGLKDDLLVVQKNTVAISRLLVSHCNRSRQEVFDGVCSAFEDPSWIWSVVNEQSFYELESPLLKRFVLKQHYHLEDLKETTKRATEHLKLVLNQSSNDIRELKNRLLEKDEEISKLKRIKEKIESELVYAQELKYERILNQAMREKDQQMEKMKKEMFKDYQESLKKMEAKLSTQSKSAVGNQVMKKHVLEYWKFLARIIGKEREKVLQGRNEEAIPLKEKALIASLKDDIQFERENLERANQTIQELELEKIAIMDKIAEKNSEYMKVILNYQKNEEKVISLTQSLELLKNEHQETQETFIALKDDYNLAKKNLEITETALRNVISALGLAADSQAQVLDQAMKLEKEFGKKHKIMKALRRPTLIVGNTELSSKKLNQASEVVKSYDETVSTFNEINQTELSHKACQTLIFGVDRILMTTTEKEEKIRSEVNQIKEEMHLHCGTQTYETGPTLVRGKEMKNFFFEKSIDTMGLIEAKENSTEIPKGLYYDIQTQTESNWEAKGNGKGRKMSIFESSEELQSTRNTWESKGTKGDSRKQGASLDRTREMSNSKKTGTIHNAGKQREKLKSIQEVQNEQKERNFGKSNQDRGNSREDGINGREINSGKQERKEKKEDLEIIEETRKDQTPFKMKLKYPKGQNGKMNENDAREEAKQSQKRRSVSLKNDFIAKNKSREKSNSQIGQQQAQEKSNKDLASEKSIPEAKKVERYSEAKKDERDYSEAKKVERDYSEAKKVEGDYSEAKKDEGDDSEAKKDERYSKAKKDERYSEAKKVERYSEAKKEEKAFVPNLNIESTQMKKDTLKSTKATEISKIIEGNWKKASKNSKKSKEFHPYDTFAVGSESKSPKKQKEISKEDFFNKEAAHLPIQAKNKSSFTIFDEKKESERVRHFDKVVLSDVSSQPKDSKFLTTLKILKKKELDERLSMKQSFMGESPFEMPQIPQKKKKILFRQTLGGFQPNQNHPFSSSSKEKRQHHHYTLMSKVGATIHQTPTPAPAIPGEVYKRLWEDIDWRKNRFCEKDFENLKRTAQVWEERMWHNLESWAGFGELVEDDEGFLYLQVRLPDNGFSEIRAFPLSQGIMVEMVDLLKVCKEISSRFVEVERGRLEKSLQANMKKLTEFRKTAYSMGRAEISKEEIEELETSFILDLRGGQGSKRDEIITANTSSEFLGTARTKLTAVRYIRNKGSLLK